MARCALFTLFAFGCVVVGCKSKSPNTGGTDAPLDTSADSSVDSSPDSSPDADLCSGFVADSSCFLPGACAAGNVASSCHDGVIIPCVAGSPSGVSETICNHADDNCNGSADELASAAACPKVVNVVVVYDAGAASTLHDPTGAISRGFDSAAARYTTASNQASGFVPKIALNLAAQLDWSVRVPSDFTPPTTEPADPNALLENFTTWVGTHRTAVDTMAGAPADFIILVTGHTFTSGVVLPWANGMCTANDTAIVSTSTFALESESSATDHLGALFAHIIGQNIGLANDSIPGSVMNFVYTPNATFVAASITAMNAYFTNTYPATNGCLDDAPVAAWTTEHCGDARKGPNEACDPGVGITDACCTSTCTVGAGCACANTDACCSAGAIRSSGTTCRAAANNCDVADFCDGVSSDCPFDKVQAPGTACTSTDEFAGACYAGACFAGQHFLDQVSGVTTNTFCYASIPAADLCTELNFEPTGMSTCAAYYPDISIDGLICGAGEQCLAGTCVTGSALATYAWTTSAWSACSSGYQTRTVACVDETGASATSASCAMPEPVSSRACP